MSLSLSSYSKEELPKVLKSLKEYKKMLKEMWARATLYFFTDASKNYRAEYSETMDINLAESYIIAAFDKHFWVKLTRDDINFTVNPTLVSGARIFSGDDMIDVTFKNIENVLKQL